jgi:hypothetical protein
LEGEGSELALRLLLSQRKDYTAEKLQDMEKLLEKVVQLTFAWVKGTLSRMSCKGDERWKAKNCIGTCWG